MSHLALEVTWVDNICIDMYVMCSLSPPDMEWVRWPHTKPNTILNIYISMLK